MKQEYTDKMRNTIKEKNMKKFFERKMCLRCVGFYIHHNYA